MKKAAICNLGCKVNAYESESMEQSLMEAGYEIVPFGEAADVCVVNTCTVTNIADHKSRQMIHRARKSNPNAIVVAVGCYVQISPDAVMADSAADIIIGNDRKRDLVELIEKFEADRDSGRNVSENELSKAKMRTMGGHSNQPGEGLRGEGAFGGYADVIDINEPNLPYPEMEMSHPREHTRAFVKIEDGCNQFCSYCAIPYARGRVRSRGIDAVMDEVEKLAAGGYKEIVLTGINLSAYGSDFVVGGDANPEHPLLTLIKKINEVEGIRRIRLGSLEPQIIAEDFVRGLFECEKLCPHFHLSLQSGCDGVLSRMNRHYDCAGYLKKCEIIRKYFQHPAITCDIIVGFPGETEKEFEETCRFVEEVGFYEIHVFKYSRRDGTPAAKMDGQVPEKVKQERSRRLMDIANHMKRRFEDWYVGKAVEVLFEESKQRNGRQVFYGFTPEYVKIGYPSEESLQNKILTVEFSDGIY